MEQKIDSSWAQKTANDLITEVENEAVYRLQITPEETDYRVNWVPTALTRRVYQLNKGDRTLLRESNGLEIPSPIGQPTAQPSMLPLESQNLEATISAKGKLRSVDLESLWRKVLEAFPLAQLPAEMLETLTGPENKARIFVLLEANIQRHFDTFFGMYPDTAVSQGDSWQARQSLSSLLLGENVAGAEIKPKGTPRWRLARTGKELELHYTGNLNLQISGQSEEISAREIATLMLDPETGLMQSLDFAIEVNLQRNHPHKPLEIHFQRF